MSITIVAVTKGLPLDRIQKAADAGLTIFAENRLQEAQRKLPQLKRLGEWHFIGHLQTNKARQVAGLFDVVESVDSVRLATKLSQAAVELRKTLRIYAQINISLEAQKHGFELEDIDDLVALAKLPGLKLEGLMGIAAQVDDDTIRSSFRSLHALRDRLKPKLGELKLSMGMSQDFEIAIEEGADLIRLGTAIFGNNSTPQSMRR